MCQMTGLTCSDMLREMARILLVSLRRVMRLQEGQGGGVLRGC